MPKNPNIADAKAIAQKYGKDCVIIFHFDFDRYLGGTIGYASFGKDRPLCERTRKIAEKIMDKLSSGEITLEDK